MEPEIHLTDSAERRSSAWDIKNAPRNYVTLVVAQAGSALFAFASVWLITRSIGSEGYGGVVALIAASQLVHVLASWTMVAVVRFGVDEFVETGKIARTFWLRLMILAPNVVLVALTSGLWYPFLSDWLKLSPDIFWLVIIHFCISAIWLHMQYGFQAVKMPRVQGMLQTLERVLIFAGVLALFLSDKLGTVPAILCYTIAPMITTLLSFWVLRKFIFARFNFDWFFLRKILLYSLPLFPTAVMAYFTGGYADAVFISKFLSIQSLGVYAVASQISGIALQLPTLANALLLPLFVSLLKETQFERLQNYFRNVFPTLILFWGLLCTIASFAGYFLIPIVFGAEFSAATTPLWILLAASTLNLPVLIGYSALTNATSETYVSLASASIAAIANIVFNILLIPVYGMEGCAWATVIMLFLSSAIYALFLRNKIAGSLLRTFVAVLPAVASAIVFSLTRSPWIAAGVCLVLGVIAIYFKRHALIETVGFIKRLRGNGIAATDPAKTVAAP